MKAELVLQIENTKLGEGPVWNHKKNVLHWVDIPNGLLHTYNPATDTNDSINLTKWLVQRFLAKTAMTLSLRWNMVSHFSIPKRKN